MAGIGFRLERMLDSDRLGAQAAALGQGVILAAGQWLIAVLGIGIISIVTAGRLDTDAVTGFRLYVVFAIMLAMIATAPVLLPMTRLTADALHDEKPSRIPGLLLAALTVATGLALVMGMVVMGALLGFNRPAHAATAVLLSLFVQVWILSSLAGAVWQVGWVVAAYILGGVVSVVAAIWAGFVGGSSEHISYGYSAGLGLTIVVLLMRLLITFPFALPPAAAALRVLAAGIRKNWLLSAGALSGAIGLWIDKWLIWSSSAGQRTEMGLPHAPIYDSAVFFGLLSMVPGLALLVIELETRYFIGFRKHISSLLGHATLAELDASAGQLAERTMAGLHRILAVQAGVSLGLILLCPVAAQAGILIYQQVPVMMLTILAAWFLFLSLAASTLLIHLDMGGRFAFVQIVFLVGVALGTAGGLGLGSRFLGVGMVVGSIAAGSLAYWLLAQALGTLNYQVFRASALRVRDRPLHSPRT